MSTPTTTPAKNTTSTTSQETNLAVVLGIAIPTPVLLTLTFVVFFIYWKKRAKREADSRWGRLVVEMLAGFNQPMKIPERFGSRRPATPPTMIRWTTTTWMLKMGDQQLQRQGRKRKG